MRDLLQQLERSLRRGRHVASFDGLHSVEPTDRVLLGCIKLRSQACIRDLLRECRHDNACSYQEHVPMVMLDPLMSGVHVVRDAGPDSSQLVRCDTDANPRSADKDAAVRIAPLGNHLTAAQDGALHSFVRTMRVPISVPHSASGFLNGFALR